MEERREPTQARTEYSTLTFLLIELGLALCHQWLAEATLRRVIFSHPAADICMNVLYGSLYCMRGRLFEQGSTIGTERLGEIQVLLFYRPNLPVQLMNEMRLCGS